jgi:hypothetical protein
MDSDGLHDDLIDTMYNDYMMRLVLTALRLVQSLVSSLKKVQSWSLYGVGE